MLQSSAENQPQARTGNRDDHEGDADNYDLDEKIIVERGVSRQGAAAHDPGLGIDPLKGRRLPEVDWFRLAYFANAAAGTGYFPGEVQQVDDADNFDNFVQDRIELEQRTESQSDQRQHHRKADAYAEQVRYPAPHAEV